MPRLILTVAAIDHLEHVQNFLADKSKEAADRAISVIIEHLEKVQQFPTIYRPVPKQKNQREIVITFGSYGYIVRYQYGPTVDTATILGVRHQRENKN